MMLKAGRRAEAQIVWLGVCGASVCVVLQHHWALNEHVHACA